VRDELDTQHTTHARTLRTNYRSPCVCQDTARGFSSKARHADSALRHAGSALRISASERAPVEPRLKVAHTTRYICMKTFYAKIFKAKTFQAEYASEVFVDAERSSKMQTLQLSRSCARPAECS
jgi:hypothetical protein